MALITQDRVRFGRLCLGVLPRAALRCWGRDVMLYVGMVAFFAALAACGLPSVMSGLSSASRLLKTAIHLRTGHEFGLFTNEWVLSTLGLAAGLTCLYHYAMSHSGPVIWRASVVGGVAAAAVSLAASLGSADYVDRVMHLGATYGSIATVMIFLIWVSWNVNAVFFGGALATEVEIALLHYRAQKPPKRA